MKHEALRLDIYDAAFEAGQEILGSEIDLRTDMAPNAGGQSGLDVVRDGRLDALGCYAIELPAQVIATTPQLLGRILLYEDPRAQQLVPTVLTVNPQQPRLLRVARLTRQPFVPTTGIVRGPGLTDGMLFGTGIDVQTQSESFGGHTGSGGFEGGHFAVAMAAARSPRRAQAVRTGGDAVADAVISSGVPGDLAKLGLTADLPIPDTAVIDLDRLPPNTRLPLKWHPDLETGSGAASAYYPEAPKLLIGSAMHKLGEAGLRAASGFADDVVRGAR